MINIDESLKMLSKTYPGFRDAFAKNAESWISNDGEFLYYILMSDLSNLLIKNISEGNYENTEERFLLVETLLSEGDEYVSNLISVGFLESLQNQTTVEPKYWAPLIGRQAVSFCKARDEFQGIKIEHYR
ncbi:DUF7674 family protein [Shewanella sedimentimangrovi]|uniref:DUF7674 domain-containing protein n=1 Tax=Shewanella sedimentimangrovi TaxID=2814293 RepID=A0ABX7R5Y8_9GAMM|nr:hypothetical protein [Shewanella sedimentimangrovi]QSX38662.1 hypothetical protein JYB85_07585 [Shewanella sedimentimangrovi]